MKIAHGVFGPLSFAGILLLAMSWLVPTQASAHAHLTKSVPAQRATAFEAPPRVQLWFDEGVEAKFCTVSVVDAGGKSVDSGDLQPSPDDRKFLSIGLGRLGAGIYTVKYRVLSVDGHVTESNFPFTIRERQ
jgi:methionine-rich copper-binding protein CopC